VTSFWNRAYQAISPMVEGRNTDLFFTELGLSLHSILLDHFKKFTINAAGGLILSKSVLSFLLQLIGQGYRIISLND